MPVNNGGNPAPGQFPYAWSSAAPYSQTQYTFTIPLDSIKMTDGCFCIAAHAAVVKTADDGTVTQEQTGWGHGENPFTGSRWGWTVNYCRQECPPPPPADTCYQTETGWGAGTRYVTKGNWATYTTYAAGGVKKIFAGQTNDAGTVSFSPVVNGMVTITIALANGWELQPGTESVKVQGYNTLPPASNPSPGLFNTYKGSELIINVPASTYYGVHLDLRKKIPCPVI